MIQTITCAQCQKQNSFDVPIKISNFVCNHCHSLNKLAENNWQSKGMQDKISIDIALYEKAIIDGKEYCLTGIILKTVTPQYKWKEYVLNAEDGTSIILSESDQHWILMKPIDEQYNLNNMPVILDHENKTYRLYETCQAYSKDVMGCFDFNPIPSGWNVFSYVNNTQLLSIEGNKQQQEAFKGRHISFKELKSYFPKVKHHFKKGIGIVQPPMIAPKSSAIIGFATIIIMLLIQLYYQSGTQRQELFDTQLKLEPINNNKEFTTPSFDLKGASAPLTLKVETDIENNWASVNVALVDEKTSETQYASQDIEFYTGIEDGERWREGNPSKSFNICGVGAGRYHMILSPTFEVLPSDTMKLDDSTALINRLMNPYKKPANTLRVMASWSPTHNNIIIFSIVLIIFSLGCLLGGYLYEREKWRHSDYSPYSYNNDEEY